ncbi:helicase-associated domain-containing protein [Kitasatospora sp. NPDC088556]|uniref:helicase-associated domain-containing protein n=1 Tax=Kitasatospora sp. NPDC088556 TaxID=3364076 RepID=UPI0037F897BE
MTRRPGRQGGAAIKVWTRPPAGWPGTGWPGPPFHRQRIGSTTAREFRCSTTTLPRTLTYLVRDTAARYGYITVSKAATVLDVRDAALAAELAHHRDLARLQLRQVGPTVPAGRLCQVSAAWRYAWWVRVMSGNGRFCKTSGRGLRLASCWARRAMPLDPPLPRRLRGCRGRPGRRGRCRSVGAVLNDARRVPLAVRIGHPAGLRARPRSAIELLPQGQ